MAQTKVQLLMPNLGDVIDFDSSTLFMDGADNRVGIRNTNPQYELDVTGTIRATNFIGTGSTTIPDWIIHEGDTNTKFGFPANDTFTVETGGSERIRFDSAGKTFIHGTGATGSNNTSSRLPNGTTLNVHGTSSNDGISIVRYSADFGAFGINIGKSNNSTFGTNTLVTNGEELGHITFYGADGTDFNHAAQITALVNGTPSDGTDMPGALSFRTSAEGSATPTERLRIDSSGNMCLGGTPFAQGTGNTFCIHSSGTGGGDHAYIYFTNGDSGHTASDGMSIGIAANQVANISVREAWPFVISTNGAERLHIESDGDVLPGADNTQDLGSSSKRWANLYTGDLHLSNSGSGNSVDGTSGSWTMQEGSDDLFLINNKTGKKYKINLTEIS